MAEIHGSVEPGFEDVRDTLSANLDSGEDVGASVAVIVDGKTVVDIWGGHRDESAHRAVGARHDHQRLVDDEDDGRPVRPRARRSG